MPQGRGVGWARVFQDLGGRVRREGLSWQRYEPMGRYRGEVRAMGNSRGPWGRLVRVLPGTGLKRKVGQMVQHFGIWTLS